LQPFNVTIDACVREFNVSGAGAYDEFGPGFNRLKYVERDPSIKVRVEELSPWNRAGHPKG